jgi:outer membrane protein OmpA-like peptidoglycan-associated protein
MLALGGDPQWRAKTLTGAGTMAWHQEDYQRAAESHMEALKLYRDYNDDSGTAFALSNLGLQHVGLSNLEEATKLFEEAIFYYRTNGDKAGIADIYNNFAVVAFHKNELDQAAELFQESLRIRRELGDKQRIADSLHNLGEIAQFQRKYQRATDYYQESLRMRRELGAPSGTALSLAALAVVAASQGDFEHSARLTGAADLLLEEIGEMLQQHADIRLRIEGHTDSVGDAGMNQALSERRAESVRRYLIGRYEIDEARLDAAGLGEAEPIDDNSTPEGRQNNRRVELVRL